jgi:hypothetical protein
VSLNSSGNLTVSGGTITVPAGNGSAATIQLNQTGVANAYIAQAATSGNIVLGNGGGDQLTITKASGNSSWHDHRHWSKIADAWQCWCVFSILWAKRSADLSRR